MFERVLTVDWSGRSKPSPVTPCADAIFTCYGDQSALSHPMYHRTRQSAMHYNHTVVDTAKDQKGTTYIRYDFRWISPRVCRTSNGITRYSIAVAVLGGSHSG